MMSGILQEICYSTGVSRDTGLWLTNRVMKENTQNVQNREPGIIKSVDLQRKYDQLRANNLRNAPNRLTATPLLGNKKKLLPYFISGV